jgi:hypothetical protein
MVFCPLPDAAPCPGVPVGRADCIAFCSALVDTPSFVASVFSVALENPPGPPARPPAAVPPGAVVDDAVCADPLLVVLVVLVLEDDPQPATAPPNRAVVPTSTAIFRTRGFFMLTTIGLPPERALGRR